MYSRYIAVVNITELDILRSHIRPHFLVPKSAIFFTNRSNTWDPISRRQFFAKSAHHDSLCSRFARDNVLREINSGLPFSAGWNTCCAMVSHARRSIDNFNFKRLYSTQIYKGRVKTCVLHSNVWRLLLRYMLTACIRATKKIID